jgi:hypothetical protein
MEENPVQNILMKMDKIFNSVVLNLDYNVQHKIIQYCVVDVAVFHITVISREEEKKVVLT